MKPLLKNLSLKEYRDKIKESDEYKPLRDILDNLYNEYKDISLPPLHFSDYKHVWETGERNLFEEKYFTRRKMLAVFAAMSIIYDDDLYIRTLEDCLWAICDEYSWVIPAHLGKGENLDFNQIDLFCAETGSALAEIYSLLHGRLTPIVLQRIKYEVKTRITDVFSSNKFGWESQISNWTAVCCGAVGCSYMYLFPEKFDEVQSRINKGMEAFIKSYPSDGICLEGTGYWLYGFGYYLCYAQLIWEFSDHRVNLFDNKQVKLIAQCGNKMLLGKTLVVSFADSTERSGTNLGVAAMLDEFFEIECFTVPKNPLDLCGRWLPFIRAFEFYNPNKKYNSNIPQAEYFLNDAQWYIKRNKNYSFAIKAGNNDEPHNHNDVGSFILATNDEQILCDLGSGRYTTQYFSPKRYEIFNTSSLGHNLPIINGQCQYNNKLACGCISLEDKNKISVDFKAAYPKDCVKGLLRTVELYDKSIKISDNFNFNDNNNEICERFISKIKPIKDNNSLIISNVRITPNSENYELSVSTKKVLGHNTTDDGYDVFVIDYKAHNIGDNVFRLNIEIL